WLQIMEAYENGGHAYHATMPTDALVRLRDAMRETVSFGFERAPRAQLDLGARVRKSLADHGIRSVAAEGFEAPGVIVGSTQEPEIESGRSFARLGLQTAAGVLLQCDEGPEFRSFRIGLFGLDKLGNVDRTVENFERAFAAVLHEERVPNAD